MNEHLPPYPRFGECIAALTGALDIKKAGSYVGRLAREGDFDWERLDGVVDELLVRAVQLVGRCRAAHFCALAERPPARIHRTGAGSAPGR